VSAVPISAPPALDGMRSHLDQWLGLHGDSLVQLRRYLHSHPELSGAEHATAALLAERLAAAGLSPVLIPGGNGIICDIGQGDPVIALRADLDALPLPDVKDVPYRSTVDGVCHACGHDVHATVVTGTGLALAAMGDSLPGRVRLVFQPSEETFPSGSLEMIAAGALDEVSRIFAVHCDPRLLSGMVGLRVGPLTAAADMIRVRLSGPGGHTARPHLTADLVGALGRVVTEVPAQLARRVDARAGLSLVFGAVHAGVAANAIPQHGSAAGTVRILDRDAWEMAPDLITRLVHEVVAPTGATAEVEYTRGVPPVVNEEGSVGMFRDGATAALGVHSIADTPQSMGGEDFSWYLEQVPGAMARLGVGRPGESLDLHQGTFDIDEQSIGHGVRLLTHTVMQAFGTERRISRHSSAR
jgi:amidohydrolase